jgi:hypothetical protein
MEIPANSDDCLMKLRLLFIIFLKYSLPQTGPNCLGRFLNLNFAFHGHAMAGGGISANTMIFSPRFTREGLLRAGGAAGSNPTPFPISC